MNLVFGCFAFTKKLKGFQKFFWEMFCYIPLKVNTSQIKTHLSLMNLDRKYYSVDPCDVHINFKVLKNILTRNSNYLIALIMYLKWINKSDSTPKLLIHWDYRNIIYFPILQNYCFIRMHLLIADQAYLEVYITTSYNLTSKSTNSDLNISYINCQYLVKKLAKYIIPLSLLNQMYLRYR